MIRYAACSVKGSGRLKNEDRVLVDNIMISEGNVTGETDGDFIALICDGVGGNAGGEAAAERAVNGLRNLEVPRVSFSSLIYKFRQINSDIQREQETNDERSNMASTVAGVIFWNNRYMLFNLGDTRIYEVKDRNMSIKSEDHILANTELYGLIDRNGYNGQALTSYLGGDGEGIRPCIIRGTVKEEERLYMICSDGIYKSVSREVLEEILIEKSSLDYKMRAIYEKALHNGSTDDISIILIAYNAD